MRGRGSQARVSSGVQNLRFKFINKVSVNPNLKNGKVLVRAEHCKHK